MKLAPSKMSAHASSNLVTTFGSPPSCHGSDHARRLIAARGAVLQNTLRRSMAPHELAARGTALYAPCDDEKTSWPRGRPADGSDDEKGLKADGALSQQAVAFLDACAEEPDGDRRLAFARRAYAAAPTAKNARRAYALALATSKRWGLLPTSCIGRRVDVRRRRRRAAARERLRFASRYGAAGSPRPPTWPWARRRRPRPRATLFCGRPLRRSGRGARPRRRRRRAPGCPATAPPRRRRGRLSRRAGVLRRGRGREPVLLGCCWPGRGAGAVVVLFGVLIMEAQTDRRPYAGLASPSTTTTPTSAASTAAAPRPLARPLWRTSRGLRRRRRRGCRFTRGRDGRRRRAPAAAPPKRARAAAGGAHDLRADGACRTAGRTTSSEFRETPALRGRRAYRKGRPTSDKTNGESRRPAVGLASGPFRPGPPWRGTTRSGTSFVVD